MVIFVLVIGNVIKQKPMEIVQQIYDLKGSTYERITSQQDIDRGIPKKDLNFIQDKIWLKIDPEKKQKIIAQFVNDVLFLKNRNVNDYSILLAIL